MTRELTPDEANRLNRILHGPTPQERARAAVLDSLREAENALMNAQRNAGAGYGVESHAAYTLPRLYSQVCDLLYDLEHMTAEGGE